MILTAFIAEFHRNFIEFKRYPTEFISQVFLVVVIFYGLFLGGKYVTGGDILGDRLSAVIISYILWVLVLDAIGDMGFHISEESQNGTLEQIFLSPLGATLVLLLRNIANLFYIIFFIIIALICIMVLTGNYLSFSVIDVIPLLMAIGVAVGIGYLVASITIVFKRIDQFLNMLQFGLLFVIMTPFTDFDGAWGTIFMFIPFAPIVGLLKQMVIEGSTLFENGSLFWYGICNLLIWMGIGLFTFRLASNHARKMGTLGHY